MLPAVASSSFDLPNDIQIFTFGPFCFGSAHYVSLWMSKLARDMHMHTNVVWFQPHTHIGMITPRRCHSCSKALRHRTEQCTSQITAIVRQRLAKFGKEPRLRVGSKRSPKLYSTVMLYKQFRKTLNIHVTKECKQMTPLANCVAPRPSTQIYYDD